MINSRVAPLCFLTDNSGWPEVGISRLKCATPRSQECLSQFEPVNQWLSEGSPSWERNWAQSRRLAARLPKQTRGHLIHKRLSKHLRPNWYTMDPSQHPLCHPDLDQKRLHCQPRTGKNSRENIIREKLPTNHHTYLHGKHPWLPPEFYMNPLNHLKKRVRMVMCINHDMFCGLHIMYMIVNTYHLNFHFWHTDFITHSAHVQIRHQVE